MAFDRLAEIKQGRLGLQGGDLALGLSSRHHQPGRILELILLGPELRALGIGLGRMFKRQKVVHGPADLNLEDLALQTHLGSSLAVCMGMSLSTGMGVTVAVC